MRGEKRRCTTADACWEAINGAADTRRIGPSCSPACTELCQRRRTCANSGDRSTGTARRAAQPNRAADRKHRRRTARVVQSPTSGRITDLTPIAEQRMPRARVDRGGHRASRWADQSRARWRSHRRRRRSSRSASGGVRGPYAFVRVPRETCPRCRADRGRPSTRKAARLRLTLSTREQHIRRRKRRHSAPTRACRAPFCVT